VRVFNGSLVVRYGVQPIVATLILFIAGAASRSCSAAAS
jgi:ribose/xylose/arabinose/galactoside ABC-type transport system permease subunit